MDIATFKRAEKAAHDFIATHGTDYAPFNTILTLCYIDEKLSPVATSSARAVAVHINDNAPSLPVSADVPQWFTDGLPQFAGRKVTSSALLTALGRPTGTIELRQAGAWLRKLVGEPSRSNGQTVFAIPSSKVQPVATNDEEDEHENPFHPNVPIASRVDFFLSRNQGKFTVQEIAQAIGVPSNVPNHKEVYAVMKGLKVPEDSPHFLVGLR